MPLRIRCPHCCCVLVAEDGAAGEARPCPECGKLFSVPLPRSATPEAARHSVTAPKCPRCGSEVATAASYCYQCHTDLRTGQRLPLKARLWLALRRTWAIAGLALAGAVLLVFVAAQLYVIRSQRAAARFEPTGPQVASTDVLADRLLTAGSSAERGAALHGLLGVEQRAAPAVAAALAASLAKQASDPQVRLNQIAAIDLLARSGQVHADAVPGWLELLARCQQAPDLGEAALRARALLGDARVAEELSTVWLERLQRRLVLSRVVRAVRAEEQPAAALVLRRADTDLKRAADGLRALAQDGQNNVFERLSEAYWESWNWLGQGRGDGLADAVFDLAKPTERTLAFKPEDVRQPRDVMKRVAARGNPAARAAAGLILEQRGPQYRTLCRSIGETLAGLLRECRPPDQQRLTWAISRLRGKLFGNEFRASPLDVTAAEVAAALEWAYPGSGQTPQAALPGPPLLTYRAVTVARQLERDLLRELQRGWGSVSGALDRWRVADLGCTSRVRELLHPGQRRPNYPALAAALIIVAESNEQALRPQLELWREAADQPAWVRALAYTTLGSLDARRGRWDSGWPAGLDLGDPARLDSGEPGWEHFGRVLAAGGPAALARLKDFNPAPLPAPVRAKLLESAGRAADRPVEQDEPR